MSRTMPPRLTGLLCAALSLSALPNAQAQFSYAYYPNDTTINSMVATDFVIVGFAGGSYDNNFNPNFTSPSSPTIQVVAGADINPGEMDIFNHSIVNVSGGNVGAIIPQNSSTLNLLPGSNVAIALNFEQSVINVSGGDVADLEGQGREIHVSGGTIGTLVANTNTDLFGTTLGSCMVNVTGGAIGEADAYNDGILNLHGGLFLGDLYARFGGTINIFGSGLTATLLDSNFNSTYSLYSLSGVLENGTTLTNKSLFIENDGVTYGHSSFTLVNATPEPGSLAWIFGLGISSIGIGIHRRRKSRRSRLRYPRHWTDAQD